MPTLKQSGACCRNSHKSTGPRTLEGKANSRFNAPKHGINAKEQFMFGETEEDLLHLAAEFHEEYQPATPTQRFSVGTLVNNEWRHRLRCVEAELWQQESDLAFRQKSKGAPPNTTLNTSVGETFALGLKPSILVQRVITSCERHIHRTLKELRQLQAETPQFQPDPAIVPAGAPRPPHPQPTSVPAASFKVYCLSSLYAVSRDKMCVICGN